jgi:hypothetical protein
VVGPRGLKSGVDLNNFPQALIERVEVVAQVLECDGFFGSPCGTLNGSPPNNWLNTTLTHTTGKLRFPLNSYGIEGMNSWRGVEHLDVRRLRPHVQPVVRDPGG